MKLQEYEIRHIERLRETLSECTVLLKKDGKFPIKSSCKIAAYGNGVRNTIKGGTGSGEVNSRYSINIEDGLEKAGFTVTTKKWLDAYDENYKKARAQFVKKTKADAKAAGQNIFVYSMGKTMLEPEFDIPLEGDGEVAIYVLSRNSGEGADRVDKPGDIQLTDYETKTIIALNDKFDKFMLVLNVGGVVDLSPVKDVKNILVLSQLGVETGTTLASILLGDTVPSGKLATTWASWDEYFPMEDFEDLDETRYKEGIYVGYRYFDTFDKKPLFPFGYGLSYTEFVSMVTNVTAEKDCITVTAAIKNTGEYKGKEVLQVYLSSPGGKLDKPGKDLCAFAKTKSLAPGEEQVISAYFNMSDMASYDEETASYILEAGNYVLRAGTSSADAKPVAMITLDEGVTTIQTKNVLGNTDFEDMKAPEKDADLVPSDIVVIKLDGSCFETKNIVFERSYEVLPEIEALSKEEAAMLNIGCFNPNQKGLGSIIGEASTKVCGAAGETSVFVKDFPTMVMADGPAGLRLAKEYFEDKKGRHAIGQAMLPESMLEFASKPFKFITGLLSGAGKPKSGTEIKYQYCTAIPIGTAIAQSFNTELAESYGDIVGTEMEIFGIQLWLAPALNIHRSIRCGRNFEYFSEDPLVSGKIAAAITNGVQKHKGCGTTIKHYAANNKELNRYCNNSIVSERAMREIYLKGFGICVKESQPKALMTSYNLLNGLHTAESKGLIEDILRSEYEYEGIVMTDWVIAMAGHKKSKYRNSLSDRVAAAGGDLFMPGGKKDYANLLEGLDKGTVSLEQVKINASRVIKMAKELNR